MVALAVVVGAGTAGCSSEGDREARIVVDAPDALADQAVRIRVTGLAPDKEVTVTSEATDDQGQLWRAHANFRADGHGEVALDSASPVSGSYHGADGMGLFWSMDPPSGDPDTAWFTPPPPEKQPSYEVRLAVTAKDRQLASSTLTRRWLADGVTTKALTPAADHLAGELFLPHPGFAPQPAVLLFGGSEGGNAMKHAAALLASHGYPSLALGYFHLPGLPSTLNDIPLEYFAGAARLLAGQPGVNPARVHAIGYSRGSEAALLLAEGHPELIHGVVVYAPSAQVNPGFPNGGNAWTEDGRPVPQETIPLDRVGPLVAIAGADDRVWPSSTWARKIGLELDPHGRPHQELIYPASGHGVGTLPYVPAGTRVLQTASGRPLNLGGTRAGDAAARAAGWPVVLGLLSPVHP